MTDLSDRARALAQARWIAAALAAGPFLLLALSFLASAWQERSALVVPAGVLGLVAPAIAWRLQARIREGVRGDAAAARRAYVRSVTVGLGVTEGAAMLGVLVWFVSREPAALVGLPMHLLMVGALWPTEERLERTEEDARP